jgi:hypothetical protein
MQEGMAVANEQITLALRVFLNNIHDFLTAESTRVAL